MHCGFVGCTVIIGRSRSCLEVATNSYITVLGMPCYAAISARASWPSCPLPALSLPRPHSSRARARTSPSSTSSSMFSWPCPASMSPSIVGLIIWPSSSRASGANDSRYENNMSEIAPPANSPSRTALLPRKCGPSTSSSVAPWTLRHKPASCTLRSRLPVCTLILLCLRRLGS